MLTSDFENDWKRQMISELVAANVSIDTSLPIMEIAIAYQNFQFQTISCLPRKVEKSDVFACPGDLQAGLSALEQKIQIGADLNPHLSKQAGKPKNDDDLLSDWGVYHFHLGTKKTANGLIERTGPVLFAFLTNTHAYMIQVLAHGAWAEKDVLEIIHRNWPQAISNYKAEGALDVAADYGTSEIAKLRKVHSNTFLKMLDGTIYSPPGGGVVTSGKSVTVMRRAMKSIKDLKNWDKLISSQRPDIVNDLVELGYDKKSDVNFTLEFGEKGIYGFAKAYSYRTLLLKYK